MSGRAHRIRATLEQLGERSADLLAIDQLGHVRRSLTTAFDALLHEIAGLAACDLAVACQLAQQLLAAPPRRLGHLPADPGVPVEALLKAARARHGSMLQLTSTASKS
jgi:6-phosphofructokinase